MNSLFILTGLLVLIVSSLGEENFLRKAASSLTSSSCEDSDQPIGACNIHLHVCGGWYSWEWQYTASATEPVSGKTAGTTTHYDSGTGAGTNAALNLVNNELGVTDANTYDCNAQAQDIKGGPKCQLRAIVYFSFDSTQALQNGDPTFNGVAYDLTNTANVGKASGFKNATEAGQEAVMNLFSIYPDVAAGCGQNVLQSTPLSFEEMRTRV